MSESEKGKLNQAKNYRTAHQQACSSDHRQWLSDTIVNESLDFLIEQASRVQELEEFKLAITESFKSVFHKHIKVEKALSFYAEKTTYDEVFISDATSEDGNWIEPEQYNPPLIYFDRGRIARLALDDDK